MSERDLVGDSSRVLDTLADGGVGIIPLDVAYAIIGNSEAAIRKIFTAKNRSFEKPSGMFSNWDLFNDIQIVGQMKKKLLNIGNLNLVHSGNVDPYMVIVAWRYGPKSMAEFYMISIQQIKK